MTTKNNARKEDLQMLVLMELHLDPSLSYRSLATRLGASVGATHFCLNALIEKGLVKVRNFGNSPHKLKYVYVLTPKGVASKSALTVDFLKRKLVEYEKLSREIAMARAQVTHLERN
jgi:EPS-associated MarR family transcriptional regulator